MADAPLNDTSWIEILNPPAPEPWLTLPMLLGILAAILLLSAVVWYWWQHGPRQQAHRQLRRLHQQLQTAQADTKPILHAIAETLRLAFHTTAIERINIPYSFLPEWQEYCLQLKQARFAATTPLKAEVEQWIQQAHYWIRFTRHHARHR